MLSAFHDLYRQRPELPLEAIAAKMSELFGITLTKNACVGKAHRLNLPQRGHRTGPRKPSHPKRERKIRMVRVDAPIAPIDDPPPPGAGNRLTIYQLHYRNCHWPLGEITDRPPFLYCGEPAEEGRSYCLPHCKKAYHGGRMERA
jgi:hypothetical protein